MEAKIIQYCNKTFYLPQFACTNDTCISNYYCKGVIMEISNGIPKHAYTKLHLLNAYSHAYTIWPTIWIWSGKNWVINLALLLNFWKEMQKPPPLEKESHFNAFVHHYSLHRKSLLLVLTGNMQEFYWPLERAITSIMYVSDWSFSFRGAFCAQVYFH